MKKFLLTVFIVLLILLTGIIIARNSLIKSGIEKGMDKLIGQKLTIGSINAGLVSTNLKVKNLAVYNPEGYTEKLLLEMPELFINYSLIDIIKGFMHFPEIRLDIKQVNVEKDKSGVLNTDHFKSKEKKDAQAKEEKQQEFLVNKLVLTIGTIRYKDNTKTPITEKEYIVNISKTFTNVSSAEQIVSAIQAEVLGKLVSEGINVALEGLKKGDFKTLTGKGKDNTGGVTKGLGSDGNPNNPSTGKEQQKSPGKLLGDLFGSGKK